MSIRLLLLVLGAALWLGACQRTPPEAGLTLTATVGTVADACADTPDLTLVTTDPQMVYYCYTIENTGAVAVPLHDLADELFGVILREFPFDLGPGESVDTVAAGLTLERTLDATTTNAATWDGFRRSERIATAEATTTVTFVAPEPVARYGAIAGTFVGDSNAPAIGAFSGNLLFIGVTDLDEAPISESIDVEITVPGVGTFVYTFDPEAAMGGVVALLLADFEVPVGANVARSLGVPVAILPLAPTGGLGTSAAVGGEFVFAFPDQTLVRTVDLDRVVTVPTVTDVALNTERDVLTVTFAHDAGAEVTYLLEGFGRGPDAVTGSGGGDAGPIDVQLSGALEVDEPYVIDVLAVRGDDLDIFGGATQIDVAEYLFYSDVTE